jgi:hypothetical protein
MTSSPTPAVLPDVRAREIAEDHGIDAWALTEQPEIIAAMLDYAGECVAAATPPASDAAVPAGLDGRCGFSAGTSLHAAKSPEWLAACELLAQQFDRWNLKDRATQIRAGHPGWLIEHACVEALLAAAAPKVASERVVPCNGNPETAASQANIADLNRQIDQAIEYCTDRVADRFGGFIRRVLIRCKETNHG